MEHTLVNADRVHRDRPADRAEQERGCIPALDAGPELALQRLQLPFRIAFGEPLSCELIGFLREMLIDEHLQDRPGAPVREKWPGVVADEVVIGVLARL